MKKNIQNGVRGAFTLVETIAVGTLITGAMALVVPTLADAREKAKRLTCQSNLSQISRAMLSYRSDQGAIPLFTTSDDSWNSWSYGGWSGRKREFWNDYYSVWNIQTNKRPLSVYMTPWKIPDEVDRFTPTQEMPLFRCPSDSISYQWQWGSFELQYGLSGYDDVGTSYTLNWNWWEQLDYEPCPDEMQSCWPYYSELGRNMYEKYIEQDPSRFIMLMEQPAEWGFGAGGGSNTGIQVQGYHGDFSTHMVGFADGHADYLYMDSRHLHESLHSPPGPRHSKYDKSGIWTVCDQTLDHPSGGRHSD